MNLSVYSADRSGGKIMETFIYTAKDIITQKKVKGEIETNSEAQVRKSLIDKNLNPISIKRKNALNSDITLFKPKVTLRDINFFCKQFAAMIQAGISIAKGLDICAQQCSNKTLKQHLMNIHDSVSEGKIFSEAVREEKIFPDILVSLIESGEASGNLDRVLKQSVEHFDKQLEIQGKVKKALTYPMIVVVFIVVVVIILMIKVVPGYMSLLDGTGAETPLPTKIVVAISNFMVSKWQLLLMIFVPIILFLMNMKRIPAIKRVLDRVSLKLPLFGELNRKTLSATFSSTMSMLIEAGIPMLQALEITRKVMGNVVAEEEMIKAMEDLRQGSSLLEAIRHSAIFPPILLSMVSIGEESGALDEMLIKISQFFQEEVDVAVDNLVLLIEPALMVIIAVVIGGIMAAIMLPTFAAATAAMS